MGQANPRKVEAGGAELLYLISASTPKKIRGQLTGVNQRHQGSRTDDLELPLLPFRPPGDSAHRLQGKSLVPQLERRITPHCTSYPFLAAGNQHRPLGHWSMPVPDPN